jgi:nucleotidyltransferase substrate binding protein (TIGR01987 family)
MGTMKERYNNLLQAYKRLDHMIKRFLEVSHTITPKTCEFEDDCIAYRDSVIKRFEFCYDLTWKFLKLYLENVYGIEVASPKKVFLECIKQNLVPEDKSALLLEIVEARNNTSHTYDEEIAYEIAQKIPEYYQLLKRILNSLTIN